MAIDGSEREEGAGVKMMARASHRDPGKVSVQA